MYTNAEENDRNAEERLHVFKAVYWEPTTAAENPSKEMI